MLRCALASCGKSSAGFGENRTVVIQDGVDLVWKSLQDLAHKLSDITLGSGVEERGVGELRNAINRHEQVLLAGLRT